MPRCDPGALARALGVIVAFTAIFADTSRADERGAKEDFEHRVVIGAGGAFEVDVPSGSVQGGGNVFVEVVAIEHWLELELGISALAAEGGVEVPIDLLFKKPFTLAPRIELMVGVGPELIVYRDTPRDGEFFGVEVALDFMFWPSRHVGFWIEPAYDLVLRSGVEHALGSTGGVIFGW
jgi:hypothetical protein